MTRPDIAKFVGLDRALTPAERRSLAAPACAKWESAG